MRILNLLLIGLLINGCTTVSHVSPKLNLGMTKAEVLKRCGPPTQAAAMKDANLKTIETFKYLEYPFFHSASTEPLITYIYFSENKVIHYGPHPESIQNLAREAQAKI